MIKIFRFKKEILASFLLISLYFSLRLFHLTSSPIFTDEAIYLRWAQIAKNDAAWRFISLTDGKQPIFVWFTMISMKFIQDPLLAGRIISVFCGLASLIIVWFLTSFLFGSRRTGFLASLLYLLFPFALVYDRMALMDCLVGTFSLLSLLFAILLVKTLRLDVALIFGAVLGGAVLTKTSGFLNIYLLPLTLLLFNWQKEKRQSRLIQWLGLALLAVLICQAIYGLLRLSPLFHMIAQKDATFVYPLRDWFQHPFKFFIGNLKGETDWLFKYTTNPWLLLVPIAFLFKGKFFEKLLLFLWFLGPIIALALFGRVLYPRFIFFMTLPLLSLIAYSFEKMLVFLKRPLSFTFFFILFSFYAAYIDYFLLTNPLQAPIPTSDNQQYFTSWPSGIGIKEMTALLQEKAAHQKITIATEGTFGMFPASLELYLWNNPNVKIKSYWPVNKVPEELIIEAKDAPVYFVLNETRKFPENWPLKLVVEYPKIQKPYSLRLYQVVSQ